MVDERDARTPGRLDLSAYGPETQFRIDGDPYVDGNELAPGRHVLRAKRLGYVPHETVIDLPEGQTLRVPPDPREWTRLDAGLDTESRRRMLTNLGAWDEASPTQRRLAALFVEEREPAFTLRTIKGFSCGGQTHYVAIFDHAGTGLEFALVPGGEFRMGPPEGESRPETNDAPHDVTLTRPFLIARTECTQEAFEQVVRWNPSSFRGATRPVERVSWQDATQFCDRVGLELPTEAQWEYACRAGTAARFCAGETDSVLADSAWFQQNAGDATHDVAMKSPNALGLYDVHGNVSEWCADVYREYPAHATIDPRCSIAGPYRVHRGGCWASSTLSMGSAYRNFAFSGDWHGTRGFRPARTVMAE